MDGTDAGWTRVSSFKPQLFAVVVTAVVSACLLVLFREHHAALPLVTGGLVMALGLIALTCKVVQTRGSDFRISTVFYSEVVRVEEVCMTVTHPGALWTSYRLHLRRPARFGWMVSFVAADKGFAEKCKSINGIRRNA